jgi:hypothetical protein
VNDNDIANKKYVDDNLVGVGIVIVSEDPASADTGTLILNTTDHKVKIYYDSKWQVLHTLTITALLLETGYFMLQETGDKIRIKT